MSWHLSMSLYEFLILEILFPAVMTLVDSEAAFEKRCSELQDGLYDILSAIGVSTFSKLAFAVGSPQAPVVDADMQRFTDLVHGGPATIGDCSSMKRLHFEAVTLVMSDLKSQISTTDASEPSKKLPYIEKVRRLQAQHARITGLSHKSEQQPSHGLIDACFSMIESGALLYLPPSKCGSRDSEIHAEGKSKPKHIITLEQGALKTQASHELPAVDVGTELKLMYAFQRRGLAFDLVHLLSWPIHVQWTDKLYAALMSDAVQGFHSISLTQILRADRELFLILAAESDGNLKPIPPDTEPPLDERVKALMNDPRINVHLTMLPKVDKRPSDVLTDKDDPKVKRPIKKAKVGSSVPDELKNLHLKTKDNKPLCWHYNLAKGCSNDVKKSRCRFGFHFCMKCLKSGHGASSCGQH